MWRYGARKVCRFVVFYERFKALLVSLFSINDVGVFFYVWVDMFWEMSTHSGTLNCFVLREGDCGLLIESVLLLPIYILIVNFVLSYRLTKKEKKIKTSRLISQKL